MRSNSFSLCGGSRSRGRALKSDGTEQAYCPGQDSIQGRPWSYPGDFTRIQQYAFLRRDPVLEVVILSRGLWKSDGTAQVTVLLKAAIRLGENDRSRWLPAFQSKRQLESIVEER